MIPYKDRNFQKALMAALAIFIPFAILVSRAEKRKKDEKRKLNVYYESFLGDEVILSGDTLTLVRYWSDTYQLHNGVCVDTSVVMKRLKPKKQIN